MRFRNLSKTNPHQCSTVHTRQRKRINDVSIYENLRFARPLYRRALDLRFEKPSPRRAFSKTFVFGDILHIKAHANGSNTVGPNNIVSCCVRLYGTTAMLALVAYSLKPVKLLGQPFEWRAIGNETFYWDGLNTITHC